MKNFKKWFANPASHVNTIVGVIGLVLVLLILIPNLDDKLCNIFLSVGCSLMATSIATFIATICITNQNEIKEMILGWKLKYIYKTKTEMNKKSNDCLDAAKKHIDIIAIGMSNFLSYKGDILEKKQKQVWKFVLFLVIMRICSKPEKEMRIFQVILILQV